MTQPTRHVGPPTSAMNATDVDEAQSLLLLDLIGEAVDARGRLKYSNSRKPTPTEVEKKLQSIINLFQTEDAPTGDAEINIAIAAEKAVVIAWLHELVLAADQVAHRNEVEKRWQQARMYNYWRTYHAFVPLRCIALRGMSVANARSFMVSHSHLIRRTISPGTDELAGVTAIRDPNADLCMLGPFTPLFHVPTLHTVSLILTHRLSLPRSATDITTCPGQRRFHHHQGGVIFTIFYAFLGLFGQSLVARLGRSARLLRASSDPIIGSEALKYLVTGALLPNLQYRKHL